MSDLVELARDVMAVMAPTTGTRATGRLLVNPVGTSAVDLPRNSALVPEVNAAARDNLQFKVDEGDLDDPRGGWEIEPGGTVVDIVSIIGGARHNLPKGTKFRFDPPVPGIETEAELQLAITDGADPTYFGGVKAVAQYESLTAPNFQLDTFRSQVGGLPAVVVVWDGSEPADGTTQSSLDRGLTRVGTIKQLFKERFNLFIITKRMDTDHLRRSEGQQVLEDITDWLTDRQEVDGRVFSAPTGIQIRSRDRVLGDAAAYQQLYVYLLQLSVTHTLQRRDTRTYRDWLRAHNEFLTYEKDGSGNRLVVVDQDVDMNP